MESTFEKALLSAGLLEDSLGAFPSLDCVCVGGGGYVLCSEKLLRLLLGWLL